LLLLSFSQAFWGVGRAYDSDVVTAVDDAISDGVDVINYSAGGGRQTTFRAAVNMAFMNAGEWATRLVGFHVVGGAGPAPPRICGRCITGNA
jgi:hypothetical protein